MKEQAYLIAKEEAPTGVLPIVTIDHIDQVLVTYGFKKKSSSKKQSKSTQTNSDTDTLTLTPTELQEKIEAGIAAALAQREKERAEENLRLHNEIREAALKAAQAEIQASTAYAQKVAAEKAELQQRLEEKERQLAQVMALEQQNAQMQKQVQDLEQALVDAKSSSWGKTFTQQASKVINKDLATQLEQMAETIKNQELELKRYTEAEKHRLSSTTATATEILPAVAEEVELVASELGEIGERAGWSGWTPRGYRSQEGNNYTGLAAIKAFIQDVKSGIAPLAEEAGIAF